MLLVIKVPVDLRQAVQLPSLAAFLHMHQHTQQLSASRLGVVWVEEAAVQLPRQLLLGGEGVAAWLLLLQLLLRKPLHIPGVC